MGVGGTGLWVRGGTGLWVVQDCGWRWYRIVSAGWVQDCWWVVQHCGMELSTALWIGDDKALWVEWVYIILKFLSKTSKQLFLCSFSGGTYGRLRVFYSTQAVSVVSEATKDGSTVLSYFSDPVSGQHTDPGTAVDVAAAIDQLLVRSLWISGFVHRRDPFGHLKIAAFMGL